MTRATTGSARSGSGLVTMVIALGIVGAVSTPPAVFAAAPFVASCRQTCGKDATCVRAAKAVFSSCADTPGSAAACFANMRTTRDACEAGVNACRARCPGCAAAAAADFGGCETAADAAGCLTNAVGAFYGCLRGDAFDCVGSASPQALARSPYPDAEAEELALEASGSLVAAPEVYARIRDDLAAIRGLHPEVVEIEARPSWIPNEIIVSFDDAGLAMVSAGTYDDWSCPNALYDMTSATASSHSVVLEFGHRLHAPLLAAEYARLPHVTSAAPNGLFGDGNDICAAIDGPEYSYVFDAGSGDCPAGCIDHTYWGFTTSAAGTITSLGTWSRRDGDPPAWFATRGACTSWLL